MTVACLLIRGKENDQKLVYLKSDVGSTKHDSLYA